LFGGRPQHLVLQRELADLAFGVLERPIIRRLGGPLALEALPARGQDIIPPNSQPMRLDMQLPGELLKQPQHHLGLLPGRPARLRRLVLALALLIVVIHRNEIIFRLVYPVSKPNRERWTDGPARSAAERRPLPSDQHFGYSARQTA
jgi:hypothetical protein